MKTKLLTAVAVACSTTALPAFAQNITDLGAVTTVGASSARDKVVTERIHKPTTHGLFVDHGNKMTAPSGVIYSFGAGINRGKEGVLKYSNVGIQGQAGYRMSVAKSLSVDALGGLEYNKFTISSDDGDLKFKHPTLKAGVGANYFASQDTSLRAEFGYAYNFKGHTKDQSVTPNSSTDLKNTVNPYVELSVLNTSIGLPVFASIYHTKTTYKFDMNDEQVQVSQTETGLKVGLAF